MVGCVSSEQRAHSVTRNQLFFNGYWEAFGPCQAAMTQLHAGYHENAKST